MMQSSLLLLAQQAGEAEAAAPSNGALFVDQLRVLFDAVTGIFSRGDALASPDHLLPALQQLGIVWSVVFMVAGLACMINGYKWYRSATVVTAMLLGAFAGYALGMQINAPFIVAGCLGALLAVVAYPLMKYMVAALGGLAGAFAGANLWAGVAAAAHQMAGRPIIPEDAYWAGAMVGLIVCGMLAFVLWQLSIVLYTSVSGSTIAVIGAIALLLSVPAWQGAVVESLSASQVVVPLLVFVPAAIGLVLQQTRGKPVMPPAGVK